MKPTMNSPPLPFLDLTVMKKVQRILVAVAGITVIAFGLALVVLPGPAFLVIPAGLAILAIEFAWARHWLRATRDFAEKCRAIGRVKKFRANASPLTIAEPFDLEALARFEGEGGLEVLPRDR
jgi:hypothetical protein